MWYLRLWDVCERGMLFTVYAAGGWVVQWAGFVLVPSRRFVLAFKGLKCRRSTRLRCAVAGWGGLDDGFIYLADSTVLQRARLVYHITFLPRSGGAVMYIVLRVRYFSSGKPWEQRK
jgi:hypothetical protein